MVNKIRRESFPSLISLDTSHVIALRTFSKILSPGLRLGWIIGDPEVIRKIVICKTRRRFSFTIFNSIYCL